MKFENVGGLEQLIMNFKRLKTDLVIIKYKTARVSFKGNVKTLIGLLHEHLIFQSTM